MSDAEPREGFIDIPGGRTHYLDWGGIGPETHLLHANGFCAGVYDPFVRHLTNDLHVIGTDIRGHGDSTRYETGRITHWRLFADDLTLFIEKKLSPPIIGIGHSLGAVTTFIAAAQSPHLFSGIVLIDPVILPRRLLYVMGLLHLTGMQGKFPLARGARRRKRVFQGKQDALKRFSAGRGIFKTWSRDFIDAYLECGFLEKDETTAVLKCDPELEAQIFESAPRNAWSYARKIKCPVLAVRGEQSDTFYPDAAENLGRYIPDYSLVTLPGTGHFAPMENPGACAGEIIDFLRRKGLMSAASSSTPVRVPE